MEHLDKLAILCLVFLVLSFCISYWIELKYDVTDHEGELLFEVFLWLWVAFIMGSVIGFN